MKIKELQEILALVSEKDESADVVIKSKSPWQAAEEGEEEIIIKTTKEVGELFKGKLQEFYDRGIIIYLKELTKEFRIEVVL